MTLSKYYTWFINLAILILVMPPLFIIPVKIKSNFTSFNALQISTYRHIDRALRWYRTNNTVVSANRNKLDKSKVAFISNQTATMYLEDDSWLFKIAENANMLDHLSDFELLTLYNDMNEKDHSVIVFEDISLYHQLFLAIGMFIYCLYLYVAAREIVILSSP